MKALGSLVAVHLLLNLLVCWMVHAGASNRVNEWLGFPLLMLGPSQGALLGFWIALGGKGTSWQVLLALGGIVAYLWCVGKLGQVDEIWHVLFVSLLCVVSVSLLLARFTGLRMVPRVPANQQRPQFSLMDAMVWMTTFAVLFGAIRWRSWPFGSADFLDVDFWAIIGSCAAVSLASHWAALGKRRLIVRILVLIAITVVGAYALVITVGHLETLTFALLLTIEAAWIVGSLLVVRLAGYRLSWQWRFRRMGVPPAAASPHQDDD